MLVAVPKPLVFPFRDRRETIRKNAGNQRRLIEPCGENRVEHDRFHMRLLDPDGFEISLVVQPP